MNISTRYCELIRDVEALRLELEAMDSPVSGRSLRLMEKALERFEPEFGIGEIPQEKLEAKLSPGLLAAHLDLDRARLELEQADFATEAQQVWELEQRIYRLLNDL